MRALHNGSSPRHLAASTELHPRRQEPKETWEGGWGPIDAKMLAQEPRHRLSANEVVGALTGQRSGARCRPFDARLDGPAAREQRTTAHASRPQPSAAPQPRPSASIRPCPLGPCVPAVRVGCRSYGWGCRGYAWGRRLPGLSSTWEAAAGTSADALYLFKFEQIRAD